jgi:predicted MFS family arabinose efflux permease
MILWKNPILMSLSLIGFGFAFIIIQSTIIQTAQQLMPSQRGTVMSLASFNMFIGGGIGTFVNGKILSSFGFLPIFLIASIIIFMAGLVINRHLKSRA